MWRYVAARTAKRRGLQHIITRGLGQTLKHRKRMLYRHCYIDLPNKYFSENCHVVIEITFISVTIAPFFICRIATKLDHRAATRLKRAVTPITTRSGSDVVCKTMTYLELMDDVYIVATSSSSRKCCQQCVIYYIIRKRKIVDIEGKTIMFEHTVHFKNRHMRRGRPVPYKNNIGRKDLLFFFIFSF